MSIRYTLRLVENGAEVWKRWTGDREEAAQLMASGLEHLHLDTPRLQRYAGKVLALLAEVHTMQPGDQRGISVLDQTLTMELSFEIRKSQGAVTPAPPDR